MEETNYKYYLEHFTGQLPVGKAFDLQERKVEIGGRPGRMYFIDGLTNTTQCQIFMDFLFSIKASQMEGVTESETFVSDLFPFIAAETTKDIDTAVKKLYSGLVAILIDGLDKIIIVDARSYPQREVSEPEKEKTLRGSKDGFTENFMKNLGLIRRRIRDNRLIFKHHIVGEKSKTDVAVAYMDGLCDQGLVDRLEKALDEIKVGSISLSDQSIVEQLLKTLGIKNAFNRLNPFPKVRYTQRPDIISAHLTEGKIAIIIDNSPTVLLLPVGIFDFTQDIDDYYFPQLTGSYLRALRILNMFVIIFVSPIYIMVTDGYVDPPFNLDFLVPKEDYFLPIFWQFILLELAIDGLKLASLNTPESLGMSLSVIGALILGDFSIQAGWFIPHTIVVMAVVALASFTQPSIELSYGIKFIRVILLVCVHFFGLIGLGIGIIISFVIVASTKTISGDSYLYPLLPFNGKVLKKLFFRTTK